MEDDAVSPVIATLLLVAVVVVLVSMISAVIFPMAGNLDLGKSASAVVRLNDAGTLPVVSVMGGKDAERVTFLTVYVSGTRDAVISAENPLVGKPYSSKLSGLGAVGRQTVSVVAAFDDGSVQTLYTGTLVFQGTPVPSLAE
ncbi:MAG: type IV pilin [Methanocorpusculum parvum]|nr:type IV pilin [Methanocorpusculum parvum]